MDIITTILIILGTAIAGILIGMWLNQTIAEKADKIVKKDIEGDNEWEGVIKMDYKHLCYSLNPQLQAAYKYGLYRGIKEYINAAWNGSPLETEDNPTPDEFLQQFEEFLNSEDYDYDKGWGKEWYFKGFEDGTHNGNYMRGYWKGYDDGWDNCKCGKERKYPLDRVYENFEKEVNSELTEYDEGYEKGWLACERYYKDNYELTPIPMSGDLILSATSSPIMDKSE